MAVRFQVLNTFIAGWCAYFAWARTPSVFDRLEQWLRRRLRQVRWKEWKRGGDEASPLPRARGPAHKARQWDSMRQGSWSWRIAGSPPPLSRAMPRAYWEHLGLTGFGENARRLWSVW